jgi:hypothetical protein
VASYGLPPLVAILLMATIADRLSTNSCAGLAPTAYENCQILNMRAYTPIFTMACLAVVGAFTVVTYMIRKRPRRRRALTAGGSAGRLVADAVINGTMSVETAEATWRLWRRQSEAAGRAFLGEYVRSGAAPWS